MFRKYAERIGWTPESKDSFDVSKTESESVRMLSEAAKEHGIWLIGGELHVDLFFYEEPLKCSPGVHTQARFLNCRKTTRSTTLRLRSTRTANSSRCTGVSHVNVIPEPRAYGTDSGLRALVFAEVHLFDIDIPNGITFKESETLTGGDWQTLIGTGTL